MRTHVLKFVLVAGALITSAVGAAIPASAAAATCSAGASRQVVAKHHSGHQNYDAAACVLGRATTISMGYLGGTGVMTHVSISDARADDKLCSVVSLRFTDVVTVSGGSSTRKVVTETLAPSSTCDGGVSYTNLGHVPSMDGVSSPLPGSLRPSVSAHTTLAEIRVCIRDTSAGASTKVVACSSFAPYYSTSN